MKPTHRRQALCRMRPHTLQRLKALAALPEPFSRDDAIRTIATDIEPKTVDLLLARWRSMGIIRQRPGLRYEMPAAIRRSLWGLCVDQDRYLRTAATHKRRLLRAGNQIGKTFVGCYEDIAYALCTMARPLPRPCAAPAVRLSRISGGAHVERASAEGTMLSTPDAYTDLHERAAVELLCDAWDAIKAGRRRDAVDALEAAARHYRPGTASRKRIMQRIDNPDAGFIDHLVRLHGYDPKTRDVLECLR